MNTNTEHEQWYAKTFGRRGSLSEALNRASQNLAISTYRRHDCAKIEALNRDLMNSKLYKPLHQAARLMRREMREKALKALWWGLVAQVRIQTETRIA